MMALNSDPPASDSQALGLQACITILSSYMLKMKEEEEKLLSLSKALNTKALRYLVSGSLQKNGLKWRFVISITAYKLRPQEYGKLDFFVILFSSHLPFRVEWHMSVKPEASHFHSHLNHIPM